MTPAKDIINQAMETAIALAGQCESEEGRLSPKVAAVLVNDDKIHKTAYRGERFPGDHAEFTLLIKKLDGNSFPEATLITTLEPCTVRGASKTPCVEHIIHSGIKHVLIGTLDPNPQIRGRGFLMLERAGISVEMFPAPLAEKLHHLNGAFEEYFLSLPKVPPPSAETIDYYRIKRLDDWYLTINRIYWHRNCDRDPAVIYLHLAELIGGLSGAITRKRKPGVDRLQHLAKAVGWWLALCGRLGVKSVEQILWDKFPGVCPYCRQLPHNDPVCTRAKRLSPGPEWAELEQIGKGKDRPSTVGEWQHMFASIFPATQTEQVDMVFGRLTEELGELAEAVRIAPAVPGYFLSEAADVFAWLMKLQNIEEREWDDEVRCKDLSAALCKEYPGLCRYCGDRNCSCVSVLPGSIGRIAHEVPRHRGAYDDGGRFITPDVTRILFQSASMVVKAR